MRECQTGRRQYFLAAQDLGFDLDVHLPKMDVKPVHAGRQSGYRFVRLNVSDRHARTESFGFQMIPLQLFTFDVTR